MNINVRYFRAKSLSWWSGACMIALGVMQAAGWPASWAQGTEGLTGVLGAFADTMVALTGPDVSPSSPAALLTAGAGLIGFRDKLERQSQDAELRHMQMLSVMGAVRAAEDTFFDEDEDEDEDEAPYALPPGESPLPPGVIDPWGEGGSRG